MPAKRRRRKLQRRQLTRFHIAQLLTGLDIVCNAFGPEPDLVEVRQAWEGLKGLLLPRWIAVNPGTRCWAWWQCDSPDRRRRVDGLHPFDSDERRRRVVEIDRQNPDANFWEVAYKLSFGVPRCWLIESDFGAVYEPQHEFLQRHELLTSKERVALAEKSSHSSARYRMPAFSVERGEIQFTDGEYVTFAREEDGWIDEDDPESFCRDRVPAGPGVEYSTAPGPPLTCNPLGAKNGSDDGSD